MCFFIIAAVISLFVTFAYYILLKNQYFTMFQLNPYADDATSGVQNDENEVKLCGRFKNHFEPNISVLQYTHACINSLVRGHKCCWCNKKEPFTTALWLFSIPKISEPQKVTSTCASRLTF